MPAAQSGTGAARNAVTALRISHLRSYLNATVETDGRSVALFGPNGAGKTNVLEAVSLFVPGRGLRRAAAEALIRRPEGIGWRLAATLATGDGAVEAVTGVDDPTGLRRTVTVDEDPVPQSRLGELIRMVWLTPALDRLWADGASDRRRFLDRMALGFFPDHGTVSLDYEKAMRDRNRLLKGGGAAPAWLDALEARMATAGARIARRRAETLIRLQDAQESANSLFPKADLAILGDMESRFAEAIRSAAEDEDTPALAEDATSAGHVDNDLDMIEIEAAGTLAERLGRERPRDMAAGRTLTGPHRSDLDAVYAAKAMPAAACSTGEQKALLISLCLGNARALAAEGPAPVLLFDEVAAHLDADRRAALYAEIDALGCQAWMTGTGPELFDGLGDALCLAVSEQAGTSVLRPV